MVEIQVSLGGQYKIMTHVSSMRAVCVRRDGNLLFEKMVENARSCKRSSWALTYFKSNIRGAMQSLSLKTVVEVGGGRRPLFTEAEISEMGLTYVVVDVSERELRLAPDGVAKLCFDISSIDDRAIAGIAGHCGLIFSQMVFEHVLDVRQAYVNIYKMLAQGGVCLNLHPVLYSPPFVANYLMPERLSASILKKIDASRTDGETPKFPAYYKWCRVSRGVQAQLRKIGFRKVCSVPFYGHEYFGKIPVLKQADALVSQLAERFGVAALASYAYTIVCK